MREIQLELSLRAQTIASFPNRRLAKLVVMDTSNECLFARCKQKSVLKISASVFL